MVHLPFGLGANGCDLPSSRHSREKESRRHLQKPTASAATAAALSSAKASPASCLHGQNALGMSVVEHIRIGRPPCVRPSATCHPRAKRVLASRDNHTRRRTTRMRRCCEPRHSSAPTAGETPTSGTTWFSSNVHVPIPNRCVRFSRIFRSDPK